ncbi:hypothetical protein GDO86_008085 [Hymenochirus boettgeri]|uniref:Anillin n=1 Tax=Hymenochirus boettgeri TaxID=247094 RepID=A0A8T2J4B3_9PIPI|nr:hypothetical protein GDO86_008085 [Hymenochirus boettgeri]
METRRQPLKRLCSYSGNESPRKKRFTAPKESENCNPTLTGEYECVSRKSCTSLLRKAELEIKPDTPAILSVRSRIQMLKDTKKDAKQDSVDQCDGQKEKPWTENRQDSSAFLEPGIMKEDGGVKGHPDVRSVLAKFERKQDVDNFPLLPIVQSTLAHCHCPEVNEDEHSSEETVCRLRKERDEELAMVRSMLDQRNPWRAESMRHRPQRKEEQGSDSGDISLESGDGALDVSEERYVSSLEVKLKGSLDRQTYVESSPLQQEVPSYRHQEPEDIDGGVSSDCSEEISGQVTMDNSEFIDRLFKGVLDSSNGSIDELNEREAETDLPPVSVLSPLTSSIALKAAISPMHSVVSSLPELLMEPSVTPQSRLQDDAPLLYSIDNYRTMRRKAQGELGVQPTPDSKNISSERLDGSQIIVEAREKIKLLNKEVSTLQRIIEQACRALSYCVDAEHGKGTLQEAEAERLLLVSMEKRQAMLKELERLRREGLEDPLPCLHSGNQKPCRGSVTISDIRLPLKVDFVCSAIRELGRNPSHYFLILIRFGSHDIVATPLASAADAQTGDTILFPTTVTLKDVSSDFNIDIEVYSLAQGGLVTLTEKRKSLKPKITPKKLLGSRKSNLNSPAFSPAVGSILKSSDFLLVGSLTLSLDSLGKFKFPLEKVPFLSPLEGSLYVKMECQSHSAVQHSGFLTMFEDVSGLGAWHRRWCVLSLNQLSFWTYPDQESLKEPLGQINLANCTSATIEPAKREVCVRPYTMELITMRPQREDDTDTLVTQCRNTLCFTKIWLSADTKEERTQWMDSLNQVLVDLRTWKSCPGRVSPNLQS